MVLNTRRVPWLGRIARLPLLVALVLAIVLVAAGAAQAQQPKRGGTLIMALEGEPTALNTFLATGTTTSTPTLPMYNFLTTLGKDLKPQPDLAESWTVSADGRTYTFKLVKNATWHDGKPFTSADVKFTLDKIMPIHPRANVWWTINDPVVTTPDDYTVVIQLKAPFAGFMMVMGQPGGGPIILPKHIWEGKDPKTHPANTTSPIGTGPYKLKEWVKGQHLEYIRNDNYFKPGKPYLDRLVIRILPDASARMLAFEKGEVDLIHYYLTPYNQVADLKKNPNITVDETGGEGNATAEFVLFNLRHPILGKQEVRHAINTALNKEEIRAKSVAGLGKTLDTIVASGVNWAFNPNAPKYPFNVQKANEMLDKAGYPRGADGNRFKMTLSWATGRDYEGLSAEVIRDQLRAVGIQVEIRTLDTATFIDRVFMNWDFDMAHQLLTTGPDPTVSVTRMYHTKQIVKASFVNAMNYSVPEVDRLLDLEFTQVDQKERAQTWFKIQERVMTDLPILPLYELPVDYLYPAKFKGVIQTAFGIYEQRDSAWIDDSPAKAPAAAQPAAQPAASKPAGQPAASQPAAAAGGDGGFTTILVIGAVVVIGVAGFVVMRRRSNSPPRRRGR